MVQDSGSSKEEAGENHIEEMTHQRRSTTMIPSAVTRRNYHVNLEEEVVTRQRAVPSERTNTDKDIKQYFKDVEIQEFDSDQYSVEKDYHRPSMSDMDHFLDRHSTGHNADDYRRLEQLGLLRSDIMSEQDPNMVYKDVGHGKL